jgi:sulfur dioxygenase
MAALARSDYIFRQLFDHRTYTYTYLIGDPKTRDAVVIDPVVEMVNRDLHLIRDLNLNLKYAINTHVHADHVTGSGEMKRLQPHVKSIIAAVSEAVADVHIKHGDWIDFGSFKLECRSTPGHTDGCMTYVWHEGEMAFTGDALLIRGCGRTDFQQGSPESLYKSVHNQIFTLPENFLLYPAHDYTGQTVSTVEEEKKHNSRLTKPLPQFIEIMDNLNLPYPREIDRALPANMVCGMFDKK